MDLMREFCHKHLSMGTAVRLKEDKKTKNEGKKTGVNIKKVQRTRKISPESHTAIAQAYRPPGSILPEAGDELSLK